MQAQSSDSETLSQHYSDWKSWTSTQQLDLISEAKDGALQESWAARLDDSEAFDLD